MRPDEIIRVKELLPTTLGSEEIRERIAAEICRRSVFSARMADAPYLSKIREVCARLAAGEINQSDARNLLGAELEKMGYSPQGDGSVKNHASIRRLNLIVETQRQMASSVATVAAQDETTLHAYPAWRLVRMETRDVPRPDWPRRWAAAGASVGWEGAVKGQFVALKESPIWAALGDGAGGFRDTLRNPYPPFAYSSGMDWMEVGREECQRLGIVPRDEDLPAAPKPKKNRKGRLVIPSLSPGEADIADAIQRYGIPELGEGLL